MLGVFKAEFEIQNETSYLESTTCRCICSPTVQQNGMRSPARQSWWVDGRANSASRGHRCACYEPRYGIAHTPSKAQCIIICFAFNDLQPLSSRMASCFGLNLFSFDSPRPDQAGHGTRLVRHANRKPVQRLSCRNGISGARTTNI